MSSRVGWRFFECEDCGQQWKSTCRDRFSSSGEDCELCVSFVHPVASAPDDKLEIDNWGNLAKHESIITQHGSIDQK